MTSYYDNDVNDHPVLRIMIAIIAVVFLGVIIYHLWIMKPVQSPEEICQSRGGVYIYTDHGPDLCVRKDAIIQ